jgi:hypothetical protein
LDKTDGNRQNPYTEALKKSPGGGKGYHNPYEWKKPNQPKKALQGQRKGYNV